MLVRAVVVDAEDGLSGHGAEDQTGALLHASEAVAGVAWSQVRPGIRDAA